MTEEFRLPFGVGLILSLLAGLVVGGALVPFAFAVLVGNFGNIYLGQWLIMIVTFALVWTPLGLVFAIGWTFFGNANDSKVAAFTAILHGAISGFAYIYLLAAMFFDPDDFIGSEQEATAWNNSLWDWEAYPLLILSGALCSLAAWLVYVRLADNKSVV